MPSFTTPKKITTKAVTTADAKFIADYNALCGATSPEPLGAGRSLVKGQWYFCPEYKNVFEFSSCSGGFKNGTVVFDLDLECDGDERASPGDEYHCKEVKMGDYHEVDKELFAKGRHPFPSLFPQLFGALFGAKSLTATALKREANKEFTASKPSREDLVVALLLTAAKRHSGNEARKGLDALGLLCNAEAKANLARADQGTLAAEWTALIQAYVNAAYGKTTASPMGVADLPSSSGKKPAAANTHRAPEQLRDVAKKLDFAAAAPETAKVKRDASGGGAFVPLCLAVVAAGVAFYVKSRLQSSEESGVVIVN